MNIVASITARELEFFLMMAIRRIFGLDSDSGFLKESVKKSGGFRILIFGGFRIRIPDSCSIFKGFLKNF